jgi:hypothetical protein
VALQVASYVLAAIPPLSYALMVAGSVALGAGLNALSYDIANKGMLNVFSFFLLPPPFSSFAL